MELRHLRYFCTVARELNFTRAAEKLNTVQPSLSQQIKDLEREVGVKLLERSNRKVELTEAGEVFLKEALLSLEHAERGVQLARQVAQIEKDNLDIGFVPVAEMKIFPYIMPNIRAHFPDLKAQFHSLTDAEQFAALRQGTIDIAFTRYPDTSSDFDSIKIFDEPLTLIVPRHADVADVPALSIKSFEGRDFVISDEQASPQLFSIIHEFFKKTGVKVNVVQHSTNILLNVNLVGMGVGWSLVPAYVIPLLGENILVKKTVEPLPMIGLYVSYRKDQKHQVIKLILKVLKEKFCLDLF